MWEVVDVEVVVFVDTERLMVMGMGWYVASAPPLPPLPRVVVDGRRFMCA